MQFMQRYHEEIRPGGSTEQQNTFPRRDRASLLRSRDTRGSSLPQGMGWCIFSISNVSASSYLMSIIYKDRNMIMGPSVQEEG